MKKNFWDKMSDSYDATINSVYADANHKILAKAAQYTVITALNVLMYMDNPDRFISDCFNHLEDNGYLIIVTDCLAQAAMLKKLMYQFGQVLGRFGIVPKYKMFKMEDVDQLASQCGFKILESENVYTTPPNYMVIAQKKTGSFVYSPTL